MQIADNELHAQVKPLDGKDHVAKSPEGKAAQNIAFVPTMSETLDSSYTSKVVDALCQICTDVPAQLNLNLQICARLHGLLRTFATFGMHGVLIIKQYCLVASTRNC